MSMRVSALAKTMGQFCKFRRSSLNTTYIAYYAPNDKHHWTLASKNSGTGEETIDKFILQSELEAAMRKIAPMYQWQSFLATKTGSIIEVRITG